MLAPETVLQGRYRIIRQLGQGGMGAVYEAIDERLDTVVALKETLFTDERLRKQFEREARLLARMHHPALPRVSDHFSEGEGQFLVMQFIAGDDLDQMMKEKQGPFPPDQVLTWGDQLLDALDYLHTQEPQIIHRDIKPQNLKITSRGQIILLDFGLAKGQSGGISVVTTSASIFGYTPNYAPLEQIQGLGTDARSDIYALSATLYHLMTGVKPPDALTRAAALVNGQPDPLTPANAISGNIGSHVAGVLARGMSQNRDQRFATAAGMRAALHGSEDVATLAGRSEAATVVLPTQVTMPSEAATRIDPNAKPTAVPGETTVVQTPVGRKRRIAPWAVAAAAVILLGGVVVAYYGYQHGKNSADAAAPAANQEGAAASQPTQETQATTGTAMAPASAGAKVNTAGQRIDPNSKRSETAAKPIQKIAEDPPHATHPTAPAPPKVETPPTNQKATAEPNVTVGDPQDTQDLGVFRRRRQGEVLIRTLPDGTKVMMSPDGRRSVILPDGTRRVLRPNVKPRRLP
ncbi:MAG TPA: protein kinase [Pyrinomonadaceae bacterium]|nr:protein kinase [Pyrinomonadaceae bacterium]